MGWPYQQKPPMGWPLDYDSGLVPNSGFWLMNEGSGGKVFDLSGNYDFTLVNGSWGAGKSGPTIEGDGVNTYIENTSQLWTQSGTLIIRIRFDTLASNDATLIQESSSGYIDIDVQTSALRSRWYDTAFKTYTFTLSAGITYDLAFTWNTAAIVHYQDGIQKDSQGFSGLSASAVGIALLADRNQGGKLNGGIEYMYYYNRTLSASEIALISRYPFWMFKDPAEVALLGGYQVVAGTILPQITSAYMRI